MRVVLLALSLGSGCDPSIPSDTGAACVEAKPLTWENFGHGFFLDYCTACHSSEAPQRYGAPDTINFDTLADVRAQAPLIRDAVLVRGVMPLGNGVDEHTLEDLDTFLACSL